MTKKFICSGFALILLLSLNASPPPVPVINVSGSLNAFTACPGAASTAQTFTISGTGLTANLVVASPSGFELSLLSSIGFADSISLTPTADSVSSTLIYIRLSASATGKPSGNIVCASTGATTQNIAVSGSISSIHLTASQTNVSCYGGSNGTASVLASGGIGSLSYLWSPYGGTAPLATGLTAGAYICSVTDKSGCIQRQHISITQPAAVNASVLSLTDVTCFGGSNGMAAITASGGTGGLNYYWSPTAVTTSMDSGLTAGTYTCYIGDANDCSTQVNIIITQPAEITTSISSQTNVRCNGDSDGMAIVSASGGTGSLTYSWMPTGGASNSASGLNAGNYTCVVTDHNGCSVSQAVTITQPAILVVTDSVAPISCFGGTDGAVFARATGGTPDYSYNWSDNKGTDPHITGLGPGTYNVSVSDHNGCTATAATTAVTQPTPYVITMDSVKDVTCRGGNNGAISITVSGETQPYNYRWTGGATTPDIGNLTAGNYAVIVTDQNMCTATATATVNYLYELPSVTLNLPFESVCLDAGTQTLSGATPAGGTFSGTGVQGNTFTPMTAGTDTIAYSYTDNNGCSNTATTNLTVSICAGIRQLNNGSISLYPNPASDEVNLKTDGIEGNLLVQIYDNLGRLVSEIKEPALAGNDLTNINISELPAAHYFMRVTAGDMQNTYNLIIQR